MSLLRKKKGLYKSLAAIVIANNFIIATPINANAQNTSSNIVEENISIEPYEFLNINGDFEDLHTISDSFASFWKDGLKPQKWDIRKHSSSKKDILGEIDTEKAISGNNAVKINLNESSGFFQQETNIVSGKDYEISTWIKTQGLNTGCSNTSHKGLAIRVEQLDSQNNVLKRMDIDKVSGTTDWKEYKATIKAEPKATKMKLVIVFDTGLDSGVSGTVFLDKFKIDEKQVKPMGITLETETLKITPGAKGSIKYEIQPSQASNEDVIWISSDENVVTINNGEFVGINEGQAVITAVLKNFDNIQASCMIAVSNDIQIDNIEFEKEEIQLNKGKNYIVKTKVYPQYVTEGYILQSEDENIATIDDGIVFGKNEGTTNIRAISDNGIEVGKFKLVVSEYEEDIFDDISTKIEKSLIPNHLLSVNDTEDMKSVKNIVDKGKSYWESMNKDENKDYLWEDLNSTTNSNHITKNFERLLEMSKAYYLVGSELNGNSELMKDIIYGLEWTMENRYNKNYYNNWWDWQIGAPQKLTEIMILTKDFITKEKIGEYVDIISFYVPNARDQWQGNTSKPGVIVTQTTGANRLDMCQVMIYKGLLGKNSDTIKEASIDILPELKYVTNGDGFYTDGSIIQHGALPYTGTYGAILLSGIGRLNYILEGTEWALPSDKVNMIYDVIENSFEPLMYKGLMMDMVNGRSISRSAGQDINNGEGVMKSIVKYYIPAANEEKSKELKSMIKYFITENNSKNVLETTTDLEFKALATKIVNDQSVKSRGELIGHYNFANMDRMVHRSKGFVFGVSMYSSRTYMHEGNMNQENLKAFHTADGMTYLYNSDVEQYSKGFWPTVDPYRLPGITVDTLRLSNGAGGQNSRGNQAWVGGSIMDNKYGATGMHLDKSKDKGYEMDLQAKKSWFTFDDEIVALGSGISSTKGRNIETIVENRRLLDGKEIFTVDSDIKVENSEAQESKEEASWAHIKGSKDNTDIGYYFPQKANINILRENRVGNWKDINGSQADKVEENDYLTMWIDHGINPKNEGYSYVLLPNKSAKEVKHYNENPNVEILSNTENIQAVRENRLKITAVNFWQDNQSVDFISTDKKSSVIVKEQNGKLKISVSDPTMKNTGTIRITLDKNATDIISKDDRVDVIKYEDKIVLDVNVKDAKGETISAEFKTEEVKELKSPADIAITDKKNNKVTIEWKNPNSKKDVKYYEVYIDGKMIDTVNNEKIKLNLNDNEDYILNLISVSKNGTKSQLSDNFIIKQ